MEVPHCYISKCSLILEDRDVAFWQHSNAAIFPRETKTTIQQFLLFLVFRFYQYLHRILDLISTKLERGKYVMSPFKRGNKHRRNLGISSIDLV